MENIMDALKGTPWWVYVLFVYLMIRGIKTLKSHVVSVKKIFILPVIFLFLSVYRLTSAYQSFTDVVVWLFFIILGYIVGWGLTTSYKILADKKKLLIKVRGTPTVLILILLVFATRYFFGYYEATHPGAHQDILYHAASMLVSGLITGIFIGRVFALLKKFAKAKHTKLKETK